MKKKFHKFIGIIILMISMVSCAKKDSDSNDNTSSSKSLFVTVGESGTILTSPEGTSWDNRTSGIILQLTDLITPWT